MRRCTVLAALGADRMFALIRQVSPPSISLTRTINPLIGRILLFVAFQKTLLNLYLRSLFGAVVDVETGSMRPAEARDTNAGRASDRHSLMGGLGQGTHETKQALAVAVVAPSDRRAPCRRDNAER
jgi:hypothetical protein